MKTTPLLTIKIFVFLCLLISPFAGRSAAYWMEIKGDKKLNSRVTIQVIYGNIDESGVRHRNTGTELVLAGDFRFSVITPDGRKENLKLRQKEDCWETSFVSKQTGSYRIVGISDTHPVVDRSATGGENILPVDYLCGEFTIGDKHKIAGQPQQFLDLIAMKIGSRVSFKAFRNGESDHAGTNIRVFNPDNWEKTLVLDKNGEAGFTATTKGMYNIRLDWIEKKSGNFKGVNYTSVRHRCNNCVFVEE